jgi:hypothetical protein
MKAEYLTGVFIKSSSFSDIYILGDYNDVWYAGSYSKVKNNHSAKETIVDLTNKIYSRNDQTSDWEWHHVVETQHMREIVNDDLQRIKDFNMPTILISKNEHSFFSRNFNNNAFRELANISMVKDDFRMKYEDSQKMITRIKNLKYMYWNAYQGYKTLEKIAFNVFDYHMSKIK